MNRFLSFLKKIYHFKFLNIRVNIFIYFIGLSFLFWLLNALNKEYTTQINLKLKYTKIPSTKIIKNDFLLPKNLNFRIKGQGFSLLQNRISYYFSSIKLNISDLIEKQDKSALEKNSFLIETANLKFFLEKELLGGAEIIDIEPPKILLLFSNISYKKVAVQADIRVSISKQFMQVGELEITPDSINIIGPVEMLDTLQFVKTNFLNLPNLDKPLKEKVDLQPIHLIKYQRSKVTITLRVEEIIQDRLSVPITITNKPPHINANLFPTAINVEYSTYISAHKNIDEKDFQAVINYDSLMVNTSGEESVLLRKYPADVDLISISPEKVKFILEKNP